MNVITPDFISMADEKFIGPLKISVSQALRFYPESLFYVYDVGLADSSKEELMNNFKNVRIIPWTLRYLPVHLDYKRDFVKMKGFGLLIDYVKSIFGADDFPRLRSLIKQSHIEIFFQNKLAIIKHHNDSVQKPFVFLDADAFLIDSIDSLLVGDFDLGVTLRRKVERRDTFNNCRLLNVGVMLFLGDKNTNTALIDEWYSRARNTKEMYSEQTSLTRLLLEIKKNVFADVNVTHNLTLPSGNPIRVRVLDCNEYNFSWIEELKVEADLEGIKILHFKNERFKTPSFKRISRWINLELIPDSK